MFDTQTSVQKSPESFLFLPPALKPSQTPGLRRGFVIQSTLRSISAEIIKTKPHNINIPFSMTLKVGLRRGCSALTHIYLLLVSCSFGIFLMCCVPAHPFYLCLNMVCDASTYSFDYVLLIVFLPPFILTCQLLGTHRLCRRRLQRRWTASS